MTSFGSFFPFDKNSIESLKSLIGLFCILDLYRESFATIYSTVMETAFLSLKANSDICSLTVV